MLRCKVVGDAFHDLRVSAMTVVAGASRSVVPGRQTRGHRAISMMQDGGHGTRP
jgi:hypothetical protein